MQEVLSLSDATPPTTQYPVVGTQKDIQYYGTTVKGVLNNPEATGMPFWSINPYVGCAFGCAYCYARYAHRYAMERATAKEPTDAPLVEDQDRAELPPWLAFERRIFVKRNAAEVLRRALQERSGRIGAVRRGETIVIGTATDPYQPAERVFRVTRAVLDVLAAERSLRLVIITKSALVTRDIDLLSRIMQHSRLTVHLSLITTDRELARRIEPRAPTPEARLRALRRLHEAGIEVGVNVMPVLPGITDRPDALVDLVRHVQQAGATYINACALRLQASARRRYLPFIGEEFPHLAARYEAAYATDYQASPKYREGLQRFMQRVCREEGIPYGAPDDDAQHANEASGERETQMELAI
jgi:DNA repair photolyase